MKRLLGLLPFILFLACSHQARLSQTRSTPELPFSVSFVPVSTLPAQALQSYAHAEVPTPDGQGVISLLVGGRQPGAQTTKGGLHTFEGAPNQNFPQNTFNHALLTLNPATGELHGFSLKQLPPELDAALSVTNAEFTFDPQTQLLYIAGGYGWKADGSDMATSDAFLSLNVPALIDEIQKPTPDPAKILAAIQVVHDPAYKVTGGALLNLNGQFFLVFGQVFDGQYRAFGGSDFFQQYTESYRMFRLKPGTLNRIGSVSTVYYPQDQVQQAGHPFHRRDGNIFEDVSPTGTPRITALGGVFRPGIIGAYVQPITINSDGSFQVNTGFSQKFSQYECPVLRFWSPSAQTVYRCLVGGIGHYWLHQSPIHAAAYQKVSKEKRNDGFPFVEDVSFQVETSVGTSEYVAENPLPGERLLGASADFLELPSLRTSGLALPNGVLNLDQFPQGKAVLIGYIYGGIEADNPLPLVPNTGTHASNEVMQVFLTKQATPVLSADQGHEAIPTGQPHG